MPIGPKRIFFAALVLLLIYAGCVYHLVLFRPYNARVNGAYGPLAGRIHRLQQEVIKDIKGKKA
jgi:hypothetical protein